MLLKKILSPEEVEDRTMKALKLNGLITPDYDPRYDPKLLAGSSLKKPTIRIKRLSSNNNNKI